MSWQAELRQRSSIHPRDTSNILEKASDACTHECLSISFLRHTWTFLQTNWTRSHWTYCTNHGHTFSSHAQGEHKTHHISLYLNSFSHIHMGTLIVQLRAIARSWRGVLWPQVTARTMYLALPLFAPCTDVYIPLPLSRSINHHHPPQQVMALVSSALP